MAPSQLAGPRGRERVGDGKSVSEPAEIMPGLEAQPR